jgi:hypothetical protein
VVVLINCLVLFNPQYRKSCGKSTKQLNLRDLLIHKLALGWYVSPRWFGKINAEMTAFLDSMHATIKQPFPRTQSDAKAPRMVLPPSLPPLGLRREEAAAYIAVSPSLFDEMVQDGRMPKPKTINSRKVWDRRSVELTFSALPGEDMEVANPWANVA